MTSLWSIELTSSHRVHKIPHHPDVTALTAFASLSKSAHNASLFDPLGLVGLNRHNNFIAVDASQSIVLLVHRARPIFNAIIGEQWNAVLYAVHFMQFPRQNRLRETMINPMNCNRGEK